MGWNRATRICALIVVALASCTLTTDLDGLSGGADTSDDGGSEASTTDDGGPIDPPPPGDDGGLLQDVQVDVVDGCSQTGCFAMPTGFSLVAFAQSARPTCPTNFTTPADTVESPAFGAGACTCGCTVTTGPTCANGTLAGHYDTAGDGLCGSAGGDLANINNLCGTDGYLGPFTTGNEHQFAPAAPSGGACSAPATKNATKLTFGSSGRFCQAAVLPECNGLVCAPAVAAPFGVCIAHGGDVACPAPFSEKHLVGASGTLNCSNGCTCSVTGTCSGGTLNYYASGNCTGGAVLSIPVDNKCHPTDIDGGSVGSHKYVANAPAGVTCTTGGSTSPSNTFSGTTTVCCN
jgi:hypothetical protein